jgi:arginyl-tRNA synthetase
VARVEVAGGGYLNAFFDRAEFFSGTCEEAGRGGTKAQADAAKTVVEHTSINPNKAAHIGHLRNAVLGDTFARLLRYAGRRVEVQNYIDNTGVQVADVVLGFMHVEPKSLDEVKKLAAGPRFDYLCWDLYARVTQFLAADKSRLDLRGRTLQEIEEGHGDAAQMAEVVATAIVLCHLHTLDRLGIDYDLLTRESEILHLKFWDAAFELLRQRNAIHLAASGKNAGCWVMRMDESGVEADANAGDDDAKIIVRSNGTVTYVGKDIAYQLWKFGMLGRDFHYEKFYTYPAGHTLWETTSTKGDPSAPAFGRASIVYNVIDARQAYLQNVVVAGLRALGHE